MSFYRIYRPQIFEELDNIRVRETLLSLLSKEKKDLPHAYLFSGSRGTGKTTAARLIAKLFQCENVNKKGKPCGTCDQCKAVAKGTAMDVIEIDAASNTGVDNIRDLREKIMLAPSVSKWKIYIIDEVHMLSTGAFNALLKTLEEPPPHAIFILATTDIAKVPITIQSRCMQVSFHKPSLEEITNALKRIVEKEKIIIDDEALHLVAVSADGSFRDAVKLLEQVSFHKGNITKDVVSGLLSLTDDHLVNVFLTAFLEKQGKESLNLIETLVADGKDIKLFLVGVLSQAEQQLLSLAKQGTDTSLLRDAIRRLNAAYGEMRGSGIVQLPLELAVVEFCESSLSFPRRRESIKNEKMDPRVKPEDDKKKSDIDGVQNINDTSVIASLLTLDKLIECWKDVIEELKPYNHSVAGVLRSSRPKEVKNGIVTIEAFYKFHQEKLSEPKTKEILSTVLKKLFGEKTKVEVVLGKK